MRAVLWKTHRWLGMVALVGVLMWGLSGVMHPIMSRLQPVPAQFMPPRLVWSPAEAPNPSARLHALGLRDVHSLHSVTLHGQAHWLTHKDTARPGVLINARTGEVVPDGERLLAEALARHYSGLPDTPVLGTRLLTRFDDHYSAVNRLLPVWEVRFARDDGLRAYIDTRQMRLATLTDHTRHTLSSVFQWAHNWHFLAAWPWLQRAVMSAILLAAATSAITGLTFWWLLRPGATRRLAHRPWRRRHRRLGLLVALTSLSFAVSGAFHLWMKTIHTAPVSSQVGSRVSPPEQPLSLPSDAAWQRVQALGAVGRMDLLRNGQQVAWWVQPPGTSGPKAQVAALAHSHAPSADLHGERAGPWLVDADGQARQNAESALAIALAARHSGLPATNLHAATLVTRFGGEYGFLNKRLPVWRVSAAGPGHPRYYVELGTGALATRVDDLHALEGAVFSMLHKWQLGELPKELRDALAATAALANVGVALIGFGLFWRRPQPLGNGERQRSRTASRSGTMMGLGR